VRFLRGGRCCRRRSRGHFFRRRDASGEANEKILGHFRGGAVDQPRANLRELATDVGLGGVGKRRVAAIRWRKRNFRFAFGESGGTALSFERQRVAGRRRRIDDLHL